MARPRSSSSRSPRSRALAFARLGVPRGGRRRGFSGRKTRSRRMGSAPCSTGTAPSWVTSSSTRALRLRSAREIVGHSPGARLSQSGFRVGASTPTRSAISRFPWPDAFRSSRRATRRAFLRGSRPASSSGRAQAPGGERHESSTGCSPIVGPQDLHAQVRAMLPVRAHLAPARRDAARRERRSRSTTAAGRMGPRPAMGCPATRRRQRAARRTAHLAPGPGAPRLVPAPMSFAGRTAVSLETSTCWCA